MDARKPCVVLNSDKAVLPASRNPRCAACPYYTHHLAILPILRCSGTAIGQVIELVDMLILSLSGFLKHDGPDVNAAPFRAVVDRFHKAFAHRFTIVQIMSFPANWLDAGVPIEYGTVIPRSPKNQSSPNCPC